MAFGLIVVVECGGPWDTTGSPLGICSKGSLGHSLLCLVTLTSFLIVSHLKCGTLIHRQVYAQLLTRGGSAF